MRKLIPHIAAFLGSKGFLLALTVLLMGTMMGVNAENTLAPMPEPDTNQSTYQASFAPAVKAYRDGDYLQARKAFAPLHKQYPENSKITYYLAITEAQLGRFQQAKKLYQEILTLDPNGEAAPLAAEGLKFLPADAVLDLPPRFQESGSKPGGTSAATASAGQTQASQAAAPAGQTPSNMSPQEWMALQMMMGQNGLSGTGGMNAMPWMTPGGMSATGNATGNGAFDPGMMSTMMMNQMMQNMNLSGNSEDSH